MVSFKLILGILFGLLVSGIAVLGVVSYQNNRSSLENAQALQQTHKVLDLTDKISSLYKDIQIESNTFYVSRDSAVIRPYLAAREDIMPRIDELKLFIKGNAVQQSHVDSLQIFIERLVEYTDRGLNYQRPYTADELRQRFAVSFHFREQIRKIINSIKRGEQLLLVKRERAYKSSIAAFNRAFLLLLSVIGMLLAATFFSIRYNFNKRVAAQAAQKKASELFARIFYESPTGIVISRRRTGEIIDCNNAYSEMTQFNKSELIGKTAVDLGIIDSVDQRNDIIRSAENNGTQKDVEIQLNRKSSGALWVSISMQSIWIDDEECLLSVILDMTSHKEAEQKIKQALVTEIELNKLKSNFIILASHEFRTPLTTILSSAFLIDNYTSGENKVKAGKHVSRIKTSVNLLISILDEFLSLTKIEEGKIEPKVERINLPEAMEAQCNTLKTLAKPGQEIIYSHAGKEQIYSDPVLLGNIVNNLVSNAIKYSGENSTILVSSKVNARIQLSVRDFGIGISSEDQAHLFERFFRASNTGNVQGTGLGLHIMKHYVDILHGSVTVQSEPGQGSQFDVTFEQLPPAQAE